MLVNAEFPSEKIQASVRFFAGCWGVRKVTMRKIPIILLLALCGFSTSSAELPPAVTAKSALRIWVDQIGYRAGGGKRAIVASDKEIPKNVEFELCDAKTNEPVWKSTADAAALKPFNQGRKDNDSGEFILQLDFSAFTTPGRYYIALSAGGTRERSYVFNIADNVYKETGLAAWKAFYYQRADCDKPEKYGGAWNHGPNHVGPNQAAEAKIYKWGGARWFEPVGKEIADPTPYDVRGGWWDAGDFNKYTGNTVRCHNELLLGVELLGDAAKDSQLNIPESGNGFPDMLDEVRYGTEFLIRMRDKTGAAFGRVHEDGTSPPEADKNPVQLTQTNSDATLARAAALAYAAVVWREFKLDDAFAQKCQDEAMLSWKLLQDKPRPWPPDPKDPKKQAYTGDWFSLDHTMTRALAAACFFKLTRQAEYQKIVEEIASKWQGFPPGDEGDRYPVIWVYCHTEGADPALSEKLKKLIVDCAETCVSWTGEKRGYAAGVKGYWWGSNSLVGRTAVPCLMAAEWSATDAAKKKYLSAAEEYIHYLNGRNAIGKCFLSNMKSFGAENSVMVMFHSWVGKDNDPFSAKYVGEGNGKIGPFPGMVVGGVNGGMKRYVSGLDWRASPWEFNEPDITYQSPCATLLAYFALKVK